MHHFMNHVTRYFSTRPPEIPTLGDIAAFEALLPYNTHDPKTGIYVNQHSHGVVLALTPLTGASEETVEILSHAIRDTLPCDITLQCLLWTNPDVQKKLEIFETYRSQKGKTYQWLAQKRVAYLEKHPLRDFEVYLVFSTLKESYSAEALLSVVKGFESCLTSIHCQNKRLGPDDFLSLIRAISVPTLDHTARHQPWKRDAKLSAQVGCGEQHVAVTPEALEMSGPTHTMTVSAFRVTQYPEQVALWQSAENLGQLFNIGLQLTAPTLISFHMQKLNKAHAAASAQMKYMRAEKAMRSKSATYNPYAKDTLHDWTQVRDAIAGGDQLVEVLHQVIQYSPSDDAESNIQKLKDLFSANHWTLHKARYLQLQSVLSALPMLYSEGLGKDLKLFGRLKTLTTYNAANLMPLVADWKGTRTPALLLPSRRGQICTWSPFESSGNYNVAIAAASGKGKSTLTQEYIVSTLGAGGRVWVIDVGRSYEKTCSLLGGHFLAFTDKTHISLNPFTIIQNFDESLSLLKPLFALMARPNRSTTDEENSYLEKALKHVWSEQGTHATVTHVAACLSASQDAIAQNLGHLLYPYTREGMYGRYFEGASNLSLDNPFIVLELEELKSKKDLQAIILFLLMYQITQTMFLGDRTVQKSCIIDEAWDLLSQGNEASAKFIETGYRRARRYNANFVTITQSIHDYFKNPPSIAAFENSDWNLILGQKPEAIAQLKQSQRLVMDDYLEHLLKSLQKTDAYSECLIKGPNGTSLHRVLLDPYSRILYSSKAEEFEAVKACQAQGDSLTEAVSKVARAQFGWEI